MCVQPPPLAASRLPDAGSRPLRAADEFRRLCQELTTLPPRTLNRLALPAELREAVDEARPTRCAFHPPCIARALTRPPTVADAQHVRIGGKRGTGSNKKGRARVEALMAQCVPRAELSRCSAGADGVASPRRIMRSFPPEKAAKIIAAGTAARAGAPFEPVESGAEYTGRPTRARLEAAASDDAEERADAWLRGLLAGDGDTSTEVFDALSAAEPESRLDRVQLRQLISKALSEVRFCA